MLKKSFLFLVAFVSLIGLGVFFVSSAGYSILLSGYFGNTHSTGAFSTGWNAGVLSFDDTPSAYSGAQVVGFAASSDVYLTGIFWLETVGWATFSDVWAWPVVVVSPGTGSNIRDPWYLSGYAWSDNAGWISLNHGESYASWVWFFPDTTSIAGYAWNDNIWWISFATGSVWVGSGFIGQVGVWGSIGGTKSFSTLYTPGSTITSASLGTFMNAVRKNVSILSRNAEKSSTGYINTDFTLSSPFAFNKTLIYKKDTNPSDLFLKYSTIQTAFDSSMDNTKSLIVIGGDIYIDTDVTTPAYVNYPRAFIALRNELWQWGNIYIKWSVKNVQASLVAEKTIWSGEEFISGALSPYFINKKSVFLDIPKTQLYIKWFIASYNTIGGSSKTWGAVCPVFTKNDETCTYDSAIPYDWNYFRSFDKTPWNRAYPNSSKDIYSVVMEPNPGVMQNPPPWLEDVRQ